MLLLKRSRRHTVGILVSTFPCGIITVFEELFGSESLTQVYAIMVEYFAKLPSPSREKILEIVYDDACHFKKFSENIDRASKNEITEFIAHKVGKHVDKFHFPNHVDAWCHKHCNPSNVKHFDGVNTPICEQLFSAINKFTNAKAMNEAHFFIFFLYIFDLHNLNIEGKLRSVANPISEHRYETILEAKTNDDDKEANAQVDEVENLMKTLSVNVPNEKVSTEIPEEIDVAKQQEFNCKDCHAKYKKEGMLKLHVKKKHPEVSWEEMAPLTKTCEVCGTTFSSDKELKKHLPTHFKCDICCTPFDDQKYLNRHIKSNHSPMTCAFCGLECSDREQLGLHLDSHLECDVCKQTFDKHTQLKRHMKSHI